jgi:hypothetical protein
VVLLKVLKQNGEISQMDQEIAGLNLSFKTEKHMTI